MNIEELREYSLSIKGAEESFPFDDYTLVFKVMNKIFLYMSIYKWDEDGFMITLKCDPEKAIDLREKYTCVKPGYHNKKYWNSIYIEKEMLNDEIKLWINHSVDEIIKKLSKKQQEIYNSMNTNEK